MSTHLMGPGEIRDRLGRLSRQRVYQITTDPSFPKPYDELQMGKVWRIEDVEAWIGRHLRPGKPGSPVGVFPGEPHGETPRDCDRLREAN